MFIVFTRRQKSAGCMNASAPNAREKGTYARRGQRGRGRVVPPSGRVLKARNRSGGDSSAVSRVYVGVSLLRCAARGLAGGRSRRCRRRAGQMTTGRTVSSVTSGDAFGVGFRRREISTFEPPAGSFQAPIAAHASPPRGRRRRAREALEERDSSRVNGNDFFVGVCRFLFLLGRWKRQNACHLID